MKKKKKKNNECNQWKHIEYTKPTVKLRRARPLSPNKNTWVAFEVTGHLKVTNVT